MSEVESDNGTMKAVLVSQFCETYGEVDDVLTLSDSEPKPKLSGGRFSRNMIVRILACSISGDDNVMVKGDRVFMRPREFPFIPGVDVCGVVEEVDVAVTNFKAGDVIVTKNRRMGVGGMAEYMLVHADSCVLKPEGVDANTAASCLSAVTSLHAIQKLEKGDRVLILGGSGGVGTSALSLAKEFGASFVATTSTQSKLCKSLGADVVINYKEQNWWEIEEYQTEKFDKIIDCVGGGNFTGKAPAVLKPRREGGRFIAVVGDEPLPDRSTPLKALTYYSRIPLRPVWTFLSGARNPGVILLFPYDEVNGLAEVLTLIDEGKLKIAMEPCAPLQFTEDGVKKAFKIQGSGHAHGKVVVAVASSKKSTKKKILEVLKKPIKKTKSERME